MVSFQTIFTLGAILVGALVIIGAGGPSGVGTKIGGAIGGGLQQFSSALTSAFTGGLFGGVAGASNVGNQQGTTEPTGDPFGIPPALNPITNQLSIFQGIIDSLKQIGNFGQQAFGDRPTLTPSQTRTTAFALTQLRPGQTIADLRVQPRQGTAVSRTGQTFISNLGGRERAFGSQESLNSFIERFNR